MDKKTALYYIDKWANYYLRILGEADDLELLEHALYTVLQPKDGAWASVFDVRLAHLSDAALQNAVNEIKALHCHVWWNQDSDRVNAVVFPEGRREPTPEDDEVFAVMTAAELPAYPVAAIPVKRAETLADCQTFHSLCFDKTLTAENLYRLAQKDALCCYIGYANEIPVSAAALLKNGEVYSLELASTPQALRGNGFALAVCQAAIRDAFREGAEVVTIRAGGGPAADDASKALGKKLGFQYI